MTVWSKVRAFGKRAFTNFQELGGWFRHVARTQWPFLLTGLVVLLAYVILKKARDMETAAQYGDFLSGIAAALAFIWLIASFRQQSSELKLQREELAAQRQALELQKLELHNMSRHSALQEVATMLENLDRRVAQMGIAGCSKANDLNSKFLGGMSLWKTILESPNQELVMETWKEWTKIEVASGDFISTVSIAARFYAEATGEPTLSNFKEPKHFVQYNLDAFKKIPHIHSYAGAAGGIASSMIYLDFGIKSVRYHGMSAARTILGDVIDKDEIENLRLEIEEHEKRRTGEPNERQADR